ncbi:Beta-ketoacyl synthase [Hyella patelloides LEGE 07179]|uniref:Phenolphthiocerol/phthiocerol polyketide synthase subunit E n=1 Tax=Hyella patelloides LEGE 07179 TaxID=945734 RepID=A0A563VNF2_9CYAN|nr:type I polyketide synthase [Hyella patelloides]VEP12990.1 Beta-ketoacyl synthase [Hyella patelloides LEGE 07179]
MNEIAITGMVGRFPGAENIEEFWDNLQNGVEAIAPLSDTDLKNAGVSSQVYEQHHYIKVASALKRDIGEFDAGFFGFSPREAEILDPQQRFFLEGAWSALENAGYIPGETLERVGVFAGVGRNTYLLFNLLSNLDLINSVGAFQTLISNDKDFLATRGSYCLDLNGPSVTVQTACSTSLVAVHFACQSLLSGECDLAIAGGVSLKVPHKAGYLYQKGGIYSPDGHCRSFDAEAKGTVGGSGMAIVVLKRCEDAISDRDTIHAVIKGSAINNDGSLKVGYTAPSVDGQAQAIAEALAMAEVDPETIAYVEAHGTATPLGDPIEIKALTQAFKSQKRGFCAIGSVKSNVGHLDAAAGTTGLIKTVLALKNQQIPPSLHFKQPNPEINFVESPFYVSNSLTEWKKTTFPRRAGVSSFGIGGTNAHVVLEEAPVRLPGSNSRLWQGLFLSAKTESALQKVTSNLSKHLQAHPELNLADVAYTLQTGRKAFPYRYTLLCQDRSEAIKSLSAFASSPHHGENQNSTRTSYCETLDPPVVFLFPGQGTQYPNMGRELYESETVFRTQIDRLCELLKPLLGLDLRSLLYPDQETPEIAQQLQQTAYAQPAIFIIEYALACLWQAWGIKPQAMMGHSIGEYVAAAIAGVFSPADALKLVVKRGQLMQQLPVGAMLSVALIPEAVTPMLAKNLSIAAINAPELCTISGEIETIASLQTQLEQQGISCRRLQTSHAFHSAMMNPAVELFAEVVANVELNEPQMPFISNVTGTWTSSLQATDPQYWATHLRQTVRFADGIEQISQTENNVFLEVGPGRTLSTLVRQQMSHQARTHCINSLRHPQEKTSDIAYILDAIAQLWLTGVNLDWSKFYANQQRDRIPLPTYPFERQRYWIEPQHTPTPPIQSPVLRKPENLSDWFYTLSWKQSYLPRKRQNETESAIWLIFADNEGLGEALAKQVKQLGQTAIMVRIAKEFAQQEENTYGIAPDIPENYEQLVKALGDRLPQQIVHLWSFSTIENSQRVLTQGFYSLLYLAQALGTQASDIPLQIVAIASQIYDITGTESLCPEKATLQGMCRVIPQEYPQLTCRSIELELPTFPLVSGADLTQDWNQAIAQILQRELNISTSEPVIAYRGDRRWIPTFEAIPLLATEEIPACLKPGGVYLVTGGLGGIGLNLAEYLARTCQAKLILVSRSGLPDRQDWQDILSDEAEELRELNHKTPKEATSKSNRSASVIRQVLNLESLGAEVLVIGADVCDRAQMQRAIEQAQTRFGEVNGVIHSAGIPGGGIIQLKTPELANRVLSAKVAGTRILDELFAHYPLDFMILNSSVSSLVGGAGYSDYCAANAFLDTFARERTLRTKQLTLAINWDTWQTVGMAVNTAVPELLRQRRKRNLELGISPTEGMEAFARTLESGLSQVIVSTKDLELLKQSYEAQSLEAKSTQLEISRPQKQSQPTHPRPNLSVPYLAPRNEEEGKLAEIWQELLGIQSVGVRDNFFELGGHSLLAIQVVSRTQEIFGCEFSLSSLFEMPTIADLAAVLTKTSSLKQPTAIQQTSQNNTEQLLNELHQLSQGEVDSLLSNLLSNRDA